MPRKLSEIFWLRILIFLPLLVPVVAYLLIIVGFEKTFLGAILISSGFVGGPPYIIFALLLILFLWKKEAKVYYQISFIAPLLFIPLLIVYMLFFDVMGRVTWSLDDIISLFLFAAVLCIPIGYLYVGLLFITKHFIIKRAERT